MFGEVGEPVGLGAGLDLDHLVIDRARRAALLAHLHILGRAQHFLGHALDLSRQRGREEQRLPIGRQRRHDLLNVGPEAHVHHAVRLVQHQELHAD